MSLLTFWDKAQKNIKDSIGEKTYETWFSNLHIKEAPPQTLVIEAPDKFFKDWLINNYKIYIEKALKKHAPTPINLEFAVNANILKAGAQVQIKNLEQNINKNPQKKANLNSRFTFDNFVIGSSNRFACAASFSVAESPAKAYNPLLIYGHVGLGKTHLIQAIAHKARQLHPKAKLCYLSSEQFTNELIDAIRHRSTSEFRKKYRAMDFLIIDDIQFIAGKESTQEEFFHTFNTLHDNRKQIILTSDRPPKEISNLEERLQSRFAWGLTADIQPPDFETRVAILRKKMETEPVKIPDDVISYIAEQIKTNIRELEGALIRVAAYSLLEECPVSLEMTQSVLKDMIKETHKIISVEMILKLIAKHFKLPIEDLRSKKRTKNIVYPRQIAMYLSRNLTSLSLPEIGHAFGGKDHTTVLHSCKKIEHEVQQNNRIKSELLELSTTLKQ